MNIKMIDKMFSPAMMKTKSPRKTGDQPKFEMLRPQEPVNEPQKQAFAPTEKNTNHDKPEKTTQKDTCRCDEPEKPEAKKTDESKPENRESAEEKSHSPEKVDNDQKAEKKDKQKPQQETQAAAETGQVQVVQQQLTAEKTAETNQTKTPSEPVSSENIEVKPNGEANRNISKASGENTLENTGMKAGEIVKNSEKTAEPAVNTEIVGKTAGQHEGVAEQKIAGNDQPVPAAEKSTARAPVDENQTPAVEVLKKGVQTSKNASERPENTAEGLKTELSVEKNGQQKSMSVSENAMENADQNAAFKRNSHSAEQAQTALKAENNAGKTASENFAKTAEKAMNTSQTHVSQQQDANAGQQTASQQVQINEMAVNSPETGLEASSGQGKGQNTVTIENPAPNEPVSAQIQESIKYSVENGQRSVSVQLNPAELGRIKITFREENGELIGQVEVAKNDTRAALEANIGEMVRNLNDSGVQVRRVDVSLDTSNEGQNQQERGQMMENGETANGQGSSESGASNGGSRSYGYGGSEDERPVEQGNGLNLGGDDSIDMLV